MLMRILSLRFFVFFGNWILILFLMWSLLRGLLKYFSLSLLLWFLDGEEKKRGLIYRCIWEWLNVNVYLKFKVLCFLWKLDFNIIFNAEFVKESFKIFFSLSFFLFLFGQGEEEKMIDWIYRCIWEQLNVNVYLKFKLLFFGNWTFGVC